MERNQLLKIVREYRGPIYGAVLGNNDIHYIQLVKTDLLNILANVRDNELTADIRSGCLYIDRALI